MTQQHPITPPPNLFKQWEDDIFNERDNVDHVLDCAWKNGFQAGADQELEACCEWVEIGYGREWGAELRATRRPKPPSLKAQAYDALDTYIYGEPNPKDKERTYNIIRRALETLPNEQ